jgi:hypothetical protein
MVVFLLSKASCWLKLCIRRTRPIALFPNTLRAYRSFASMVRVSMPLAHESSLGQMATDGATPSSDGVADHVKLAKKFC